jgi:hypothetical protein
MAAAHVDFRKRMDGLTTDTAENFDFVALQT